MFSDKEEQPLRPLAERLDEPEEDIESLNSSPSRRWFPKDRLKHLCCVILFVASNVISSQIGAFLALRSIDYDRECAPHTTQYCRFDIGEPSGGWQLTIAAPVLKDVKIKYAEKQFNGTFMEEDVYRRPASPEVDAAWEALGVDCESSPSSKR